MAEYFSQLLPLLDRGTIDRNDKPAVLEIDLPRIELFLVFNPSLADPKSESHDELAKQILCCLTPQKEHKWLLASQSNIVGTIQGLDSLSLTVTDSSTQDYWTFDSNGTRVIVQKVEGDYYLVCSVAFPESFKNFNRLESATLCLSNNIVLAYSIFTLINSTFKHLALSYNRDVLELTLRDFWGKFLMAYNANGCEVLGQKGFLNVLPNTGPIFKKSTKSLGPAASDIIRLFGEGDSLRENSPSAVLISCLDRSSPKKYGSIHMDKLGSSSVLFNSLINLYNFLEHLDYGEHLAKKSGVTSQSLFSAHEVVKLNSDEDSQGTKTQAALDLLNPMYLATNLVVLPVNYTVNGIRNTFNQDSWLPQWMSKSSTVSEPVLSQEDEDADLGYNEYLTGPNSSQIVFLETEQGPQEFRLVTYQNKSRSVSISLIFDASFPDLDKKLFYDNLAKDLDFAIDEIEGIVSGSAALGNSLNSLPQTLKGINLMESKPQSADVDSSFFFVSYDKKNQSFKSSLPYLPKRPNNSIGAKFKLVMHNLHNQLIDILLVKKNHNFFREGSTEYFHKFSVNKHNDWMLYYLKYHDKYILIVKNHSKLAKKKNLHNVPEIPPSLLTQITSGVYDYAHLGFLDNLGDDIKLWLENLTTSDSI